MTGPFTPIGKIKKSHGLKGELRVHIEDQFLPDFNKAKVIFLGNERSCIPYFILNHGSGSNFIIKLEDVDSKEAAEAIGKQEILLPESNLTIAEVEVSIEEEGNNFLIGYELWNEDQAVGEILRIDEYPQQDMIICLVDNREILIPLHPALVVDLDEENKVLSMAIPDGLLEL